MEPIAVSDNLILYETDEAEGIGFVEDTISGSKTEEKKIVSLLSLANDWESYDLDGILKEIENQAPPGPPPRQGLVWKPQTHRWIRPKDESSDVPTISFTDEEFLGDLENEIMDFAGLEYNDLIDNPDLASTVSDGVKELRLRDLGEREAMKGYFHLNDWVDGQIMNIIGMRSVLAEMRDESLDKEAIRTQLSGVFQSQGEVREVTDSPIDLALEIGRMSLMTAEIDEDGKPTGLSIEPFKELMRNEQKFTEKRTRELFGDSIEVHRALYGPAAIAIQEQLKSSDSVTVDSFPMSSYSTDVISCYAFATQQGRGQPYIVFSREIPAEDILSAWYSNNVFLDNMPAQKEVVISPKNLQFSISKEDIKFNFEADYDEEEAEERGVAVGT